MFLSLDLDTRHLLIQARITFGFLVIISHVGLMFRFWSFKNPQPFLHDVCSICHPILFQWLWFSYPNIELCIFKGKLKLILPLFYPFFRCIKFFLILHTVLQDDAVSPYLHINLWKIVKHDFQFQIQVTYKYVEQCRPYNRNLLYATYSLFQLYTVPLMCTYWVCSFNQFWIHLLIA